MFSKRARRKEHLDKGYSSPALFIASETRITIIKVMRVANHPYQIAEEGRRMGKKLFDRPSPKAGKKYDGVKIGFHEEKDKHCHL